MSRYFAERFNCNGQYLEIAGLPGSQAYSRSPFGDTRGSPGSGDVERAQMNLSAVIICVTSVILSLSSSAASSDKMEILTETALSLFQKSLQRKSHYQSMTESCSFEDDIVFVSIW